MNQDTFDVEQINQEVQVSSMLSLGQMLKDARERRGLSKEDIADQIRISPSVIVAIEADHYKGDTLTVYIRGYARAYARIVGVSENDLEKAFIQLGLNQVEKPEHHIRYEEMQPTIKSKHFKVITYLIILGLVFLVFVWFYTNHQNEESIVDMQNDVTVESIEPQTVEEKTQPIEIKTEQTEAPMLKKLESEKPIVETLVVEPKKENVPAMVTKPKKVENISRVKKHKKTVVQSVKHEPNVNPWVDPDA